MSLSVRQTVNDVGNFLEAVQELIFSNSLNNTYKLALIIAIADLALDESTADIDDDKPLYISFDSLAEKFLEIYWPQTNDYQTEAVLENGVREAKRGRIAQGSNAGQLKIFTLIDNFCRDYSQKIGSTARPTFLIARRIDGFDKLVKRCRTDVVVKNPLHFIKGSEFLYTIDTARKALVVTPAHAMMLRRFHTTVTELARTRWEAKVRGLNKNAVILGESPVMSLREFLFNQNRNENLEVARNILTDVTGDCHCFYCGCPLGKAKTHVDHFLPYRIFNLPRIHNFVLACEHCNTSKSDTLVSDDHVTHWVERNVRYGNDLFGAAQEVCFPNEYQGFYRIVRDTYENALFRNEDFWMASGKKPVYVRYLDQEDKEALLNRFEPLVAIKKFE